MKKDIISKWKSKVSRNSYTHIGQCRCQAKIRSDKESYDVLIKGTIHQEDIIILNIYAPNISALNFIKQALLNVEDG
jgi:hypothetical protein